MLQALLTLAVALVLVAYVATRRDRSVEAWILVALLAGLGLWSLGTLLISSTHSNALLQAGLVLGFVGVSIVAPLWLLLAARQARLPIVIRQLPRAALAILAPSAIAVAMLVSNPLHRLFFRVDLGFGAPPREIIEAAGPAFWIFATWSQLCGCAGALLLLASARRMRSRRRRRPALLLSAAALLPIVTSVLFLSKVLPTEQDPTPLALALSLGLVTIAIFRFGILDGTLPLARQDVLEHLDDGLLVADTEGVILDSNPAAAQLLGRDDLRGRSLLEVLRLLPRDVTDERLEAGLAIPEEDEAPLITVLRSRDDRWVEMRSAVVSGQDGEPAGQYVILHDRTEQRRYERFVHQSQKIETVGHMVAGIAHEVNNPLAYVRSNLGTLLQLSDLMERQLTLFAPAEREELAEMRQIVEETLDGVERIGRIVDGLRRYSRPDRDEALPVDLNAVARQAIRLAELHESRNVVVHTRLGVDLPPVKGSADRLGQVVLNLLMNAKHALGERPFGRITVETLAQRSGVELHVIDNGPGIPEDIQERIFDPFFTTKPPETGTGLGLSIAFDIVREHQGSLEIASRPGEGARFVVRLPVS